MKIKYSQVLILLFFFSLTCNADSYGYPESRYINISIIEAEKIGIHINILGLSEEYRAHILKIPKEIDGEKYYGSQITLLNNRDPLTAFDITDDITYSESGKNFFLKRFYLNAKYVNSFELIIRYSNNMHITTTYILTVNDINSLVRK